MSGRTPEPVSCFFFTEGGSAVIKKLVILLGVVLIISSGCSQKTETEKLLKTVYVSQQDREKTYSHLESRLAGITDSLNTFGIEIDALSFNLADLNRSHLGWKILTDDSVFYAWNKKALDNQLDDLKNSTVFFDVKEITHFSSDMEMKTPLYTAMSEWSDHDLILWILREFTRPMTEDQILNQAMFNFWIYKCTEVVLTDLKGASSLEVARFKNIQYDRIAWASQVADLQTQFQVLRSGDEGLSKEEYFSARERLYDAWLRDYRDSYQSRFLTNEFRDFGDSRLSDRLLADLDLDAVLWSEYQQLWNEIEESLEQLSRLVLAGPGAGQ